MQPAQDKTKFLFDCVGKQTGDFISNLGNGRSQEGITTDGRQHHEANDNGPLHHLGAVIILPEFQEKAFHDC
jgi:hypothetical protein